MNRRECLGALAALFAGVAIPEPVRHAIWVRTDPLMRHFTTTIELSESLMAKLMPMQRAYNDAMAKVLDGIVESTPPVRVTGGLGVTGPGATPPLRWDLIH